MTDKELKRLSRTELLELLVNQVEENEALKAQVSALTAKLEERAIQIEESGSLAEAALKLSGIFSAADEAAERYLENRKRQADELCAEKEKETQERCMEVIRMIGERARKQEEETSGTPVESDGGDGPC